MNPGKLNKRIAFFEKKEVKRDNQGGKQKAEWDLKFSIWASRSERSAVRRVLMGDHVNYVPAFWIIRKCDKVPKVNMRIEYNTSVYDILNITDLDNGYLEIETKLVKPV